MNKTIPQSRKSASSKPWDFCWDTTTPEGQRDVSARLIAEAKQLEHIAPDEARNRMASARALRGQPKLTGTIVPTIRICRILRTPRARARRTAPATAARAADSGGGGGDPDPEPPRSSHTLYSLPASVVGGAL